MDPAVRKGLMKIDGTWIAWFEMLAKKVGMEGM